MEHNATKSTLEATFSDEASANGDALLREPSRLRIVGPPRPAAAPRHRRLQALLDGAGRTPLMAATDACASALAVAAAVAVAGQSLPSLASGPGLAVYPLVLVAAFLLHGLYRRTMQVGVLDLVGRMGGAISVAAMVVLGLEVVFVGAGADPAVVAYIWAFSLLLIIAGRAVVAQGVRMARARRLVGKPTLLVGAGVVGDRIAKRLEERPEYGLRPVGFLDADPLGHTEWFDERQSVLGSPDDIAEVAAMTGAEHVIFAFTRTPDHVLVPLARRCDELGLEVSVVPRFFESSNSAAMERVGNFPLQALQAVDPQGWQFTVKYALDRVLALLLLLVAAPVMATAALAVKLSSPGPILFKQRRVGRDGLDFELLKFRSMRDEPAPSAFQVLAGLAPGGIEGADRRTKVGKFLRRTAIDELPQLFNVLKGEMSLVGPRPERPEYAETFGRDVARYTDRHRVKSGITGCAQINGSRGQTPLRDRIEWDNFYIENWSLWFDLKILLLTVGAVIRTREDA